MLIYWKNDNDSTIIFLKIIAVWGGANFEIFYTKIACGLLLPPDAEQPFFYSKRHQFRTLG